jgi:hypothetical protein
MDEEEKMILSHEPVPGYKRVIHIAMLVAALYLAIIFLRSFL